MSQRRSVSEWVWVRMEQQFDTAEEEERWKDLDVLGVSRCEVWLKVKEKEFDFGNKEFIKSQSDWKVRWSSERKLLKELLSNLSSIFHSTLKHNLLFQCHKAQKQKFTLWPVTSEVRNAFTYNDTVNKAVAVGFSATSSHKHSPCVKAGIFNTDCPNNH